MSANIPAPSLTPKQESINKSMRITMRKHFYPQASFDPDVLQKIVKEKGADFFAKEFAKTFKGIDTLDVQARDPAYLLFIAQTMFEDI
jgi:hypothetical protein